MKTYNIFESNILVNIPDLYVDEYEKCLLKLDNQRVSYLAYVSGGREGMSENELVKKIIQSIIAELKLYINTESIINKAKKQGYIDG